MKIKQSSMQILIDLSNLNPDSNTVMNEKELIKEGKEIEQELKALHKRLKAETKDLKKRYKAHMRNVDKFCDKHSDDTDLCLKVGAPFDRAERALYFIPDVVEGWNHF
jgi:hypothetical protein